MGRKEIQDQLAAMRQQMGEAMKALSFYDRFPAEPEIGTVVRFEKTFVDNRPVLSTQAVNEWYRMASGGRAPAPLGFELDRQYRLASPAKEERTYTYAALRTPIGWVLTGYQREPNTEGLTWDQLCEHIGDNPVEIATEWVPLSAYEPPVSQEVLEEIRAERLNDEARTIYTRRTPKGIDILTEEEARRDDAIADAEDFSDAGRDGGVL